MNAIQKFIRDAIIRAAKSGEALTIDSLIDGSGVDHERVVTELSLFVSMGLLDAPGDLTRATAIQMKRLTAHGEVIHQGKLDFARDGAGEVIHLQMEEGGAPALTIGDDTYHVFIKPSDDEDGTYTLAIVECQGTKFETIVVLERGFQDAESARFHADGWLRQREEEGYRWEFGRRDQPGVDPNLLLIADLGLTFTDGALPPFRLSVAYQHEGIQNPDPVVVQQDFDSAEDAWEWWAQVRRALVEEVFFANIPDMSEAIVRPDWVGPLNVDADTLERCKNCLSFRELRDGGIAKPAIEIEGLPADGKWVCGQIMPGTHEGVILLAVLNQVVPDCEGGVRFKYGGEGFSQTGTKALLYLGGYPEAEAALEAFMEQEGLSAVPYPEPPTLSDEGDEVDQAGGVEPIEVPAPPEPVKESDEPDFPF